MFHRILVGALLAFGALSWGNAASAKPTDQRDHTVIVREHQTRSATSTAPQSHPTRIPIDRVPKEVHHNPGPTCGRPNGPCE